ncbi:hypothetical protein P3T73_10010 [Kiritimatiellota bacterium B12222]|nr:hypothetical protein P3T73_10010 [Kiritimatiellota bacterium B12222]
MKKKITAILLLGLLSGCGKLELTKSNADVVVICRAVVTKSPSGNVFQLEPVEISKGFLSPKAVDPKTGFLLWSKTLPTNAGATGYYELYLKEGLRKPPATVTSIRQLYLTAMKSVQYQDSEQKAGENASRPTP